MIKQLQITICFLLVSINLFADSSPSDLFVEKAKRANSHLCQLEMRQAFSEYSEIIDALEIEDRASMEFAYWIFRERGYVAHYLGLKDTANHDRQQMEQLLIDLGHPVDAIDEYDYAISLLESSLQHAQKLFQYSIIPCNGAWDTISSGFDWVRLKVDSIMQGIDESLCRATQNKDRLEHLLAQKRARELYYSHLVYTSSEIERLANRIREEDRIFKEGLGEFLSENHDRLLAIGAGTASGLIAVELKNPKAIIGAALLSIAAYYEIKEAVREDGGALWAQFQEIQKDRITLTGMEKVNREASYAKCVVGNTSPGIYFAPANDTPWYNGYYAFDVNNSRVEFSFSVSKRY